MSLELASLIFVIAVLVGAAIVYFALVLPARTRVSNAERRTTEAENEAGKERAAHQELAIEKATVSASANRVPQLEGTITELREKLESANRQIAEAQASLETERKTHEARVEELQKMGAEIEQKFEVLASKTLGKNSENFLRLMSERFDKHKTTADKDLEERQKAIETLIKPISENLAKFEHKVGELEKAREGAYRAITEQVKSLAEGQSGLRSETSRLVQALRRPKTRGRWGEYQLRNVLEMAGIVCVQ